MTISQLRRDERGVTLVLALMLALAVAALALGGIMMSSSATLTGRFQAREASLRTAADAGLEIARDTLNRGIFDTLLAPNRHDTLVLNGPVRDANGNVIPGFSRSVFFGRTGGRTGGSATAGQYGTNYASVVSVIRDQRQAVAARRLLLTQESWAKFAVAINNWSGSAVYGCGESVMGPFFSNNALKLMTGCTTPKPTFYGPVAIVNSSVTGGPGDFRAGLQTRAQPIPWPTPARLALMQQYAQNADAVNGDYDLTGGPAVNTDYRPWTRIEFITVDVNRNGVIDWDEGFMRVFRANQTGASPTDSALAYLSARRWPYAPSGTTYSADPNMISQNCGADTTIGGTKRFYRAAEVYALAGGGASGRTAVRNLLTHSSRKCYLGGDPRLYPTVTADTLTPDSVTTAPYGRWMRRRTGPLPALAAVRPGDAQYLIPLSANPNFKGVIYVTGNVAISGRLRGRVSVFATGNILFADDLLYTLPPGSRCDYDGDIFGAIAGGDMVIQDNNLNTPFRVNNIYRGGFDDSPSSVNMNLFFLTLGNFLGEGFRGGNPASGYPNGIGLGTPNACGGAPNGCIRVTGGLAMGRVDYATYNGTGYGWAEAHAYDACGATHPPPYFPTTGRFIESRYYELDPVWLNQIGVDSLFAALRSQ
ncbi:MAG: hypothetical protein ACOY71_05070 [Gemmatimonadota bacterium]